MSNVLHELSEQGLYDDLKTALESENYDVNETIEYTFRTNHRSGITPLMIASYNGNHQCTSTY